MHLFRLLFHFPFCHESLLKCLFDWNRPCCSHTLLLAALHPAITSRFLSLSFYSSVAELELVVWHPSSSPLLSPTCILFLSIDIKWRKPPAPPLSARVCLFHVGSRRGKLRCFVLADTALSRPALILDNRKRTHYSQFNYWQFCMQRCMWIELCVCVCILKEGGYMYYWLINLYIFIQSVYI